jgi:toxin ParE1/3/4
LLDIWAYIARENAPSVADALLARIHGALEVLAFAPKIGRERHAFSGRPRSFVVRPYIVFYEPLPDDAGILVWRIIHGAGDLQRLIHPPQR